LDADREADLLARQYLPQDAYARQPVHLQGPEAREYPL
jgi:hypothetical protein